METLPGRWLWGGVLWRHFGHFVVESTGRLWGFDAIKGDVDGVLFIPKSPKNGNALTTFQSDFFRLSGAQPRVLTLPTRVENLLVPGQGMGIGRIIIGTKACKAFYHDSFAPEVKPEGPDKLYISRSEIGPNKGALVCERQFEKHLEAQGYEVFHPQKHNIETQIARYRAAKMVIACEGSAIHMFALVARPEQKLAVVLRRNFKATNCIERHVRSFGGIDPLMINEVQKTWRPVGKDDARFSRGQPNYPAIQTRLAEAGFLSPAAAWPALTDEDVVADLSNDRRPDVVYYSPKHTGSG